MLLIVDVPVKRKIEKSREKVLYHESVLKRNQYVQPVPSSLVSKKDKKKFKKHAKKKELQEPKEEKSVPMVLTVGENVYSFLFKGQLADCWICLVCRRRILPSQTWTSGVEMVKQMLCLRRG
jgi:hypothetical protein